MVDCVQLHCICLPILLTIFIVPCLYVAPNNLPAELIPQYTTIEYEMPDRRSSPPVFLFVVDLCLDEDELKELKDSIQQSLNLLPENALVGLITFGKNVLVHEIGFSEMPKSYVFRAKKKGDKEYIPYTTADISKVTINLGLSSSFIPLTPFFPLLVSPQT